MDATTGNIQSIDRGIAFITSGIALVGATPEPSDTDYDRLESLLGEYGGRSAVLVASVRNLLTEYVENNAVGARSEIAANYVYGSEFLATGSLFAPRRSNTGDERQAIKRQHGTFYTPGDVATLLARESLTRWQRNNPPSSIPHVLDPACGTGVLLCAAADELTHFTTEHSTRSRAATVIGHLRGYDINSLALDCAAFSLVYRLASHGDFADDIGTFWRNTRSRLITIDALRADSQVNHSGTPGLFSSHSSPATEERCDVLLANPPFSVIRVSHDGSKRRARSYLDFVRLTWRLTRDTGGAGIVLPLSLAFAKDTAHRQLRIEISQVAGDWSFSFFDRAPDAIFGDSVKTRVCIAFLQKTPGRTSIASTSLQRWAARDRHRVLASQKHSLLHTPEIEQGIPRVGSAKEVDALERIGTMLGHPEWSRFHWASARRGQSTAGIQYPLLGLGKSAYNYLPVRVLESPSDLNTLASGQALVWIEGSDDALWSAYALLSSRFTYWWWSVTGDGFHFGRSDVMRLPAPPISLTRQLAGLGKRVWEQVRVRPIVSVNKRVRTMSYSPWMASDTVDKIDAVVCAQMNLPQAFGDTLRRFVGAQILATRSSATRSSHHLDGSHLSENG